MRVIIGELKKIWNIKILMIIAILGVLFGIAMNGYIVAYPRGTWFFDVDFAHLLTEKYGTTLEQPDFEDFLNYEEVIIREVDEFVASRQVFIDAGIFTFADFLAFRDETGQLYETLTDEEAKQRVMITGEMGYTTRLRDGTDIRVNPYEPSVAYTKWISFHNVVGAYQRSVLRDSQWGAAVDNFIEGAPLNERELQRAIEIRDSGELKNIMSYWAMFHTWRYARQLGILVILATLILVSQLITTDRANRVNWLQYSSKQGRSIFKKQFVAVLISSIAMTTLLIAIFAGMYGARTDVHELWNNGINSFLNFNRFYWLPITFGEYILLTFGVMYLLSIGAAAFAFVMSRFSSNKIRLMFKIVPFFIAANMLSNWILSEFLEIYVGGDWVMQLSAAAVMLLVGILIAMFVLRREKRVELL